jgi:hypothetical protein
MTRKKMLPILALLFTCMLYGKTQAQSFNFSFSQSQKTYSPVSSATQLSSGQDWTYGLSRLPLGFSFKCQGDHYDSVSVLPGGLLAFTTSRGKRISTLSRLICKQDSNGNFSTLRYRTTGTSGNHIFCLEYGACGLGKGPTENINVQVWLYEASGAIEFHFGPNSYQAASNVSVTEILGIYENKRDGTQQGYLISGSAASAGGSYVSQPIPSVFLTSIPANGTVYTMTPAQ